MLVTTSAGSGLHFPDFEIMEAWGQSWVVSDVMCSFVAFPAFK